ncbi:MULTISPECIES: hypothetical protein [Streptomyces]|nr:MULTISPECIES: hypothetical protein [Streptomyces]MYY81617.1 hypothetical protein [Streptomyces sp. SID335]NDZ88344.1 hypothetical protein [Streptomyces sp. SID10115]NEA01936.1 hypothetical protein [Streptomyces sp. SID10116]NEB45201.1 hypothetical protein [Streptomyces sp. SID339]
MTTGPAFRLARAAMFAAVCVVTTALGHTVMSGATLPWWAVGYAFTATVAAAWWLTGRERGAAAVIGATVAAQLCLHELFGLAQRMAGPSGGGAPAGTRGHPDDGMNHLNHPMPMNAPSSSGGSGGSGSPAPFSAHSAAMPDDGLSHWVMSVFGHSGSGMFLAHVVAALICALWLWRGEAAVFRTGRALAAAVFVPLRLVLAVVVAALPPTPSHVATRVPVPRLRGVLLQHVVSRRGPPVLPVSS